MKTRLSASARSLQHFFLCVCFFLFAGIPLLLPAQTDVRAWYAEGQVWIIWKDGLPLPLSVGVYAKSTSFTNTEEATLIGRPLVLEYLPTALKEQVEKEATYRIPDGKGGLYQLAPNEGLFVFTPHQAGALYFAVTAWGENKVTPGQNITATAVSFQYDPVSDPVECHLQAAFPSPFTAGYACFAYYMWADGREDHQDSRPDFPVMANRAKNGMPGFFLISVPIGLDTTKPFPLNIWLHGGGGNARQSLAGSRQDVNINPKQGILLAHNDDMFGYRDTVPPGPENVTWHFGWRKHFDPFNPNNKPIQEDTVINYTQRRYIWIDQWLMRRFNVDPARIHIHGHSMGSAGATALAKAFPEHYASASIFNNGFGGPEENRGSGAVFGEPSQNFPTNLINRKGETVFFLQLFNITDNISPARDLPLLRSYHGKNDDNGTMRWDAYVVESYRIADSMGHGMHLFWSERAHGIDTSPAFDDHWIKGNNPNQQTNYDNVDYVEAHFRSDISYPAFFNNRLDPNANDPGDGTIGTGAQGTGDDWGAWGGWHRWDNASIIDQPGIWRVEAWLESNALFGNDNCPYDSLVADLAIRRPQKFLPATGKTLIWRVEETGTGSILQQGMATVQTDNLVVLPKIAVYRKNLRTIRILVADPTVTSYRNFIGEKEAGISVFPNPSSENPVVEINAGSPGTGILKILSADGKFCREAPVSVESGKNRIELPAPPQLPAGFYFVIWRTKDVSYSTRWVKIND